MLFFSFHTSNNAQGNPYERHQRLLEKSRFRKAINRIRGRLAQNPDARTSFVRTGLGQSARCDRLSDRRRTRHCERRTLETAAGIESFDSRSSQAFRFVARYSIAIYRTYSTGLCASLSAKPQLHAIGAHPYAVSQWTVQAGWWPFVLIPESRADTQSAHWQSAFLFITASPSRRWRGGGFFVRLIARPTSSRRGADLHSGLLHWSPLPNPDNAPQEWGATRTPIGKFAEERRP